MNNSNNQVSADASALIISASNKAGMEGIDRTKIEVGVLYTPHVRCCPPGVTRKVILDICEDNAIEAHQDDIVVARMFDMEDYVGRKRPCQGIAIQP